MGSHYIYFGNFSDQSISLKGKIGGAAKAENIISQSRKFQDSICWGGMGDWVSIFLGVSTAKKVDGNMVLQSVTAFKDLKSGTSLQEPCKGLCLEFPDLLKHELGCLKVRPRHASQENAGSGGYTSVFFRNLRVG